MRGSAGAVATSLVNISRPKIQSNEAIANEGKYERRRTLAASSFTTNQDTGLVAGVEGDKVRLSATGAVAATMEEEKN